MFMYTGLSGNYAGKDYYDDRYFHYGVFQTRQMGEQWPESNDLGQLIDEVDSYNEKYNNNYLRLSIYEEDKLLYPSGAVESSLLPILWQDNASNMLIVDTEAVYREDIDPYSLILTNDNYQRYSRDFKDNQIYAFYISLMVLGLVIIIVLVTNWLLTRFIIKSILAPLDILTYGVQQIRDGNLDYRIEHKSNDEFAGVCADFNDMAARLLASVKAGQRDEANRKELIAGISHDLRTPLTSIKAYVEGLEKGLDTTPLIRNRYFETIKSKAADLEQIINKLFLFSKLDVGEFPFYLEQMDLGEELAGFIVSIAEEYEKKGLKINLTQNVQNAWVRLDVVQFRNAVVNVLENSVKYKREKEGIMGISAVEEGDQVIITFTDDGPGVPPESIDKLFDVFYRSDPSRSNPSKGSGLGLAITAKILERLGGRISAANAPEGGLSIIMTIPKYEGGDSREENPNN